MRYRLVCLDAGFTLLAPRRTLAAALGGVLAERGHPVSEEQLHAAWQVANRWFWEDYHRPDNRTWGDDAAIERTWRQYHALMLSELGYADRRHELLDLILASQFSADAWELYPDVEPTLTALKAIPGMTLAVVSDWGSNLVGITQALGLDRWVDFVLASGAEGLAKPDPAFFGVALSRAGVGPGEALMVGDTYHADVEGAIRAGMDGVLLRRPSEQPGPVLPVEEPPPGTTIISSLTELLPMVSARR